MSCGSKDIFKNAPFSCSNTHQDVTYLVNHGMVTNTESWLSWEWNTIFPQNKKNY